MRVSLALLALALFQPTQALGQEDSLPALAARFDLDDRVGRFDLPGRLDEISGLAFSPSGVLYGHGDERGVIYSLDPAREDVGRGFTVGPTVIHDDFEDMAVVGDRFFLVSSGGRLYEFREAPQGGSTPVRITETGVGGTCEVEGLAYEPRTDVLLLACKAVRPDVAEVRIHRLPLDPAAPIPPPIRIPFEAFASVGLEGGVHPSGMDVDPVMGTLVLVAAQEEALVEIDREGRVVSAHRFSARRHPQPEGIVFGPDGRLYIADEANNGKARLTAYGPLRPEGSP